MKKKYGIVIPILIIVHLLTLINSVNGFNCNLIAISTDKTEYYIDEDIKINASWELSYNVNNEIAYIQIHILNYVEDIIWNSSNYNEIGVYEKNWTVNIEKLNMDFNNYSSILYVKFFIFYFQIDTTNTMCTYLETIKIRAVKRNLSCELSEYTEFIKLGENVHIIAKFYSNSSEGCLNLINQTIQFIISSNNIVIYYCNYTTNSLGNIELKISSLKHLNSGKNFLIFLNTNNRVFNDSKFIFEIFVEKNPVFVDIIVFNENLKKNENLEIKLYYYYYINQELIELANHNILLSICCNKTLLYINDYKTDSFGFLNVSIPQVLFNSHQIHQDFIIDIDFNGNYLLDNKSLSFSFKLEQDVDSVVNNFFQINIFSLISILTILLILFSYVISNRRRKNGKLLTELIVRF
ncbi:MAG: hypothetical protein ACFE9Q_05800 [Candidatus Hodarchaeota archaeon]